MVAHAEIKGFILMHCGGPERGITITITPTNDIGVEKYNYVQANQSTAYFSNLKSAQMFSLL